MNDFFSSTSVAFPAWGCGHRACTHVMFHSKHQAPLSPVPGSSRWSRRCSRFHNYKGLPPPPGYDHTVRPHWHTAGRCAQTNSTIHYITTGVQNCRTFDGQNLQYFTLKCLMLWVDTISTVVQAICNKVEILYSYFSIYTLLRVPVWEEHGKQYSLRASDIL